MSSSRETHPRLMNLERTKYTSELAVADGGFWSGQRHDRISSTREKGNKRRPGPLPAAALKNVLCKYSVAVYLRCIHRAKKLERGSASSKLHTDIISMKNRRPIMKIYVFVLMLVAATPAVARVSPPDPSPEWLHNVSCRIASRDPVPSLNIKILSDVFLDTLSGNAADRTVVADIKGGRKLAASVQHVNVDAPSDRFNVTMTLDGRTHLRLNHLDLDIFIETTIDGQAYILHCLREIY